MLRRVLLLLAVAFALASCQIDVAVDVAMNDDGSGVVSVTATADKSVVDAAPGLAEDLRFADLEAVGWNVEGPTAREDGGLTVVLTHEFATPAEAGSIVATLGGSSGPFRDVAFTRTVGADAITFAMSGSARVDAGLATFADSDLIAAIDATPYANDVAEAGQSPAQAVRILITASLPGKVSATTSTATDGTLVWTVPIDGSGVDLATTSSVSMKAAPIWGTLSTVFVVLMIGWILVSITFISLVVHARAQRRKHSLVRYGSLDLDRFDD